MGNLTELHTLHIDFLPSTDGNDDGDEARMSDLEMLTRILLYLRNKVFLSSFT